MKKICKECGKEIKGKPVIYDDYYFCTKTLCLGRYLNPEEKMIKNGKCPPCPKCKSENTTLKEDDSDNLKDLCILCFGCGYDERETKPKLK